MPLVKKNRLNELDGKKWLQNSFSIWRDIKKNGDERKLNHPAIFPSALTSRIIEIFTQKNDLVVDPFMGCGSSVLSAMKLNRKSCGIELNNEFFKITQERIKNTFSLHENNITPQIYNDDARNLKNYLEDDIASLCVTSPPYWDILNQKRTADNKSINNYGNSLIDIGNIKDYKEFLIELSVIFKNVYDVLKKGGYCVVVVMDLRKKSKFYPLHIDVIQYLSKIGFYLDDIIIWDRQHEYNNMRPLGYPYKFRVNKIHEYILIFSKNG